MSRTHHATRTWRLSCGCLRDYPGMPVGRTHPVMCVTCQAAATALYAYPERCCGAASAIVRAADGGRVRVSCTIAPGNKDCARGVHYDENVRAWFAAAGALKAGAQGQIGRA